MDRLVGVNGVFRLGNWHAFTGDRKRSTHEDIRNDMHVKTNMNVHS